MLLCKHAEDKTPSPPSVTNPARGKCTACKYLRVMLRVKMLMVDFRLRLGLRLGIGLACLRGSDKVHGVFGFWGFRIYIQGSVFRVLGSTQQD